jgi:MoxR-like ATPase
MQFIDIHAHAETEVDLPECDGLSATRHAFDARSLHAINTALAAGRPLLVRGEPGTGKSQLARAAARILGRCFAWKVVDAETEVSDLFFRLDAVERLARAQVAGALRTDGAGVEAALDEQNFVRPGLLWWAFDARSAAAQRERHARRSVGEAAVSTSERAGHVVLIDEIDKADPSVPNGLLEALGQGTFAIPGGHTVVRDKAAPPPLVVITTNEERELPSAFVRRCMVLQIHVPVDPSELRTWLERRGRTHFPGLPPTLLAQAASLLAADRRAAQDLGLAAPGQAEYLDLLRAVSTLTSGDVERELLLREIAEFALKKHPDLHEPGERVRS